MRKRTHEQICPNCKSLQHTIIKNSKNNQYYCKSCDLYFTPKTTRSKYSSRDIFIYRTISRLIFRGQSKITSIKQFIKSLKNTNTASDIPKNVCIKYEAIKKQCILAGETTINIDGDLQNSVILTRSSNGFVIVEKLDLEQTIKFNDYVINISKIKADNN